MKKPPPESVPFESVSEPLLPQWEPVPAVELSPHPDYPRPHIRVDRSKPIEWKGRFFRAVFTPDSAGAWLRWFDRHETEPDAQRHWQRRFWERPMFWSGSSVDGFYYIGFFVVGKDKALQALEAGNAEPFFQLAARYGPRVTEEDPDTREIVRMWWQQAWDDLDNTAWKQLQRLYAAILGREIGRPKGRKPQKVAATNTGAMSGALADALAKANLLPTPFAAAANETQTIVDTMGDLTAEIYQSTSQAQALADALQAAATASANIQIPAVVTATGQASGGLVRGSGSGDTVPAMLTPGEFVMNQKATQQHLATLAQWNAGMEVAHFAAGGFVGFDDRRTRPAGSNWAGQHGAEIEAYIKRVADSGQAAKDAATSIADLNKQLAEIVKRRFAITTSLASQLAQIGAISQTQAIKTNINILLHQLTPLMTKFAAGVKLTADQLKEAEDLTGQLRDAVVSRYQAEVDEIQKVHDAFKSATDAVQSALKSVTSQGVTPAANLSQLEVQAAALRQQLATAPPEKQPALIEGLAQVLQQQFQAAQQVFSPTDQRLVTLRESIVQELLSLQGQAEQGVQDTTTAITDMRTAVVTELQTLVSQQDALAQAQQSILQAQLDQLTQINKRPGASQEPHRTIFAQGGDEGIWPSSRMTLQPHAGEYVSVRPDGKAGESTTVNVSVNVSGITVHVPEGVSPERAGQDAGRELLKFLQDHSGDIGDALMRSPVWPKIKSNINRSR